MRRLLFLLLLPVKLLAQTYPVQINLQLAAPFSGYLPDYAAPDNSSLRALVLFNDFSHAGYDVKFRIRIEGQGIRIQSQSWYFSGPFTLTPGVPQLFTGNDFADLLNENNLEFSGITRQQYDLRKVLPEGFYTITLTAYDFQNPVPIQVSNDALVQAWMMLNDPPYLNFPACGNEVAATDPQQLTFSWTPMNLNSPSSAPGTDYTFELWEIFPANMSPGLIVANTAPLYSAVLNQSLLNYGLMEPPLVTGREYVWRVRAQDAEHRELFRNNGYSQLCTFTWGNNNSLLGNLANLHLSAQALTHRQARCSWDSSSVFTSYRIEFRKVGSPNWFPLTTDHASLRITDLEPNTSYEAQVQGIFPNGNESAWSNLATWHTPAQPILNCGESSPPPAPQNFHPLLAAHTGMTWQIGQFEMIVTSLQNFTSSNGRYAGTGKIILPLGITIACEFNMIEMGDDQVMYAGEVRALSEGITNWISQWNMSAFPAAEIEVSSQINGPGDIQVNVLEGEITIDGHTYTYETGEGTAIEDADGTLWVVTADGSVVYAGQTGVVFHPVPADHINSQYGKAVFTAATNQLYGFDAFTVNAWRNYYGDVTDVKDGAVLPVAWKSVQSQKYDELQIHLSSLGTLPADSVFFYSPTGTIYASHGNGNDRKIYLVGSANKTAQQIYAGFHSGDSIVNIGKINVISFEEQTKKVWLVPFGNASTLSAGTAQTLKAKLDSVYRCAVIRWTVAVPGSAFTPSGWDKNHDGKLAVASTSTSHYSSEQQAIITALKYQPWYNRADEFLLLSSVQPDSSQAALQGEMPRNSAFGFLFGNAAAADFSHLAAHELGHGAFALEHTFTGNAPAPPHSTDNLLDYANGNALCEWQWMWMHNPSGWTGLDEDAAGAYAAVDVRELLPFLNSDSASFTFYSPAGEPVTLPKDGLGAVVFSYGDEYALSSCNGLVPYDANPVGSLFAFVLDNRQYVVSASCSSHSFTGYSIGTSNNYYIDTISRHLSLSKGIIGYPCVDGGNLVFVVGQQEFLAQHTIPASGYMAAGTIVPHVMRPDLLAAGNATTTIINAVIQPPYSTDAQNYLLDQLPASTCGSGRSSYVLTYAYQINRYPLTYTMCFRDPEPTSANGNSSAQFIPRPDAYLSIPETTPFEQLDQQLDQLRLQTRQQFYEVDIARRTINADILAITSPSTMAGKLITIADHTCLYNQLSAQARLHAIEVLCQSSLNGDWWGMGNGYEHLVNKLLYTVQLPAQQDSILLAFEADNNALLQKLWSELDNDGLDEFVNTVTGWMVSGRSHPVYAELETQAYISSSAQNNGPVRYFEFYPVAGAGLSQYRFETHSDFVSGTSNIHLETLYDDNVNDQNIPQWRSTDLPAFGWVAIKIQSDIPSLGLHADQRLVVPMFWAQWLSLRVPDNDVTHFKTLIEEVLLFAATDGALGAFGELFSATQAGTTLSSRMVGNELKAFVTQNGVESELATAELGEGGEWVFRDVQWGAPEDVNVQVVGKMENVKYSRPGGDLVTGELQILRRAGGEAIAREVIVYNPVYTAQYVSALNGFSDNLPALLAEEHISMQTYLSLELKAAGDLTPAELAMMNRIRARIPAPGTNTLMQKCIPKSDIDKYLSGRYTSVQGFVTTAADAKHLETYTEIYEGMRLDYDPSPFQPGDGYCGVIRFKATNLNSLEVPRSPANGGNIPTPYPFTGTGFTSGENGALGVPEWRFTEYARLMNGAELWTIDNTGIETLIAVFDQNVGKFVPVK